MENYLTDPIEKKLAEKEIKSYQYIYRIDAKPALKNGCIQF